MITHNNMNIFVDCKRHIVGGIVEGKGYWKLFQWLLLFRISFSFSETCVCLVKQESKNSHFSLKTFCQIPESILINKFLAQTNERLPRYLNVVYNSPVIWYPPSPRFSDISFLLTHFRIFFKPSYKPPQNPYKVV